MADHDMSDEERRRRGLPPRASPEESQYPPPPGEEEDDRPRAYHHLPPPQPGASGVTLPSIHDPHTSPYGGTGSQSRYPPPPDPRDAHRSRGDYSASPTGQNGYPPPPGYLPPVQPHHPDTRGGYGVDPRDYYGRGAVYPPPPPPEPYNYPGGPGPYRPSSASPYGGYPDHYGRGGMGPQQQQAAPRQRTSIACRYCRKRKIRCSGYSQTPDGKCTNCKKTGNECIFQPVSSGSSTAFVPVSAVPGGVPPGTPLYGAFGQPLAPSGGGQPGHGPGHGQGHYPPPSSGPYDHPLPSPTGSSYYSHTEEHARRRPHEDEHGPRLPPPNNYTEESRRSPASSAQDSTPPMYDYPADRTPTPRRVSPGGHHPPAAQPQSQQQQQQAPPGSSGVMSLSHMVDGPDSASGSRPAPGSADANRDIDQSMLGRLNKRT